MQSVCQRMCQWVFLIVLASSGVGCSKPLFKFNVVGDPSAIQGFMVFDTDADCFIVSSVGPYTDTQEYRFAVDFHCVVKVVRADGSTQESQSFLMKHGTDPVVTVTYDVATDTLTVNAPPPAAARGARQGPVTASKQGVNQALQVLIHFLQVNVQSPEDIEPFFEQVDADGSGGLSLKEVKAAAKTGPEKVKGKFIKQGVVYLDDTYGDGDGELQLEELVAAYLDLAVAP